MKIVRVEDGFDGSEQYELHLDNGGVVWFSKGTRIIAHTWMCPGEGRIALESLENLAKNENALLTIPSVLNKRLAKILMENGYESIEEWVKIPFNKITQENQGE